jgi:hypothetical protein
VSRADLRTLGAVALLLALVLGATALVRHGLIEPAPLAHRCDEAPRDGAACVLRGLVVQAFSGQRLGWVALCAGLLATVLRRRALAWAALALGAAALMLYAAAPGATGALLGGLVLARAPGR